MSRTTAKNTDSHRTIAASGTHANDSGFNRKIAVLKTESQEAFNALLECTKAEYQPSDRHELRIVHELVVAIWRLNRIVAARAAGVAYENDHLKASLDPAAAGIDHATRMHLVISALVGRSPVYRYYDQQERRLRRIVSESRSDLQALRAARSTRKPPSIRKVQKQTGA